MATGDVTDAQSSGPHKINITLTNNDMGSQVIPTIPDRNKYATFKMDLGSFDFNQNCITRCEIAKVSIVACDDDGWHIHSISTIFIDKSVPNGCKYCGTIDIEVDQWIEDDDIDSREELVLTLCKC